VARGVAAPEVRERSIGAVLQTPVGLPLRASLLVALGVLAALAVATARPAGAAAKGPSVGAELTRLLAAGQLDPAVAASYRDADRQARATLKKLSGTRRGQLAAVVSHLDAAAAGGLMAPSRLPALFLTLQRNRAFWAAAPLPAPGQRLTFARSQVVWQFYPGQGLQIQWLGTFGKANALWASRTRDDDLRALLDEALGLATQRAGGLAFEYLFTFDGGRPPWVSGLAQGTALSALARAAVRLKDPKYFEAARAALGIFRTPPPAGIRVATPAGAHYLQYSFAPRLHIVNGFTQALNGLRDFAVLANDPEGQALFAAGEAQLRTELPGFDTGAWSLYSKPGPESDLSYHRLLRDFLRALCDRLTEDRSRAAAAPAPAPSSTTPDTGGTPAAPAAPAPVPDPALYCDTAQRFDADLRTPPVVTVTPGPLRARAAGVVRFSLSKVSAVTVTVVRQGVVVLSRTARLGGGDHQLGVRPARAQPLLVRVRAVDLAGNAGAGEARLTVAPAARKHHAH
jgi:hypothetical protein